MKTEIEAIAKAFDEMIVRGSSAKLRGLIVDAMAKAAPPERKIVQIAEGGVIGQEGVHPAFAWTTALCNDGTVWIHSQGHGWGKEPLPPIPQGAARLERLTNAAPMMLEALKYVRDLYDPQETSAEFKATVNAAIEAAEGPQS